MRYTIGAVRNSKNRPRNIVKGQKIGPGMLIKARELRRAMTSEERLLWYALRRNKKRGLHFRRQQVIAGFIVDFYCHSAALAIELDGAYHDARSDYDAERDKLLSRTGIRVLRIENKTLIGDPDAVAKWIHEKALRRSQRPN